MSFSDKIDAAYSNRTVEKGSPEAFEEALQTILGYVKDALLEDVELGRFGTAGLFGGGRRYVSTDINVRLDPKVPENTIVIKNKNTVHVYSSREDRMMRSEMKKLANKEGIKYYNGALNMRFEYFLKG